jgi:hypothetical protein
MSHSYPFRYVNTNLIGGNGEVLRVEMKLEQDITPKSLSSTEISPKTSLSLKRL